MKWIKGALSLLWRVWFICVAIISTLFWGVFFILPFSFRAKDYDRAYYYLRIWGKMIFYCSGLRIKKHNFVDLAPHHPYIIIGNHTSMMDIMLLLIVCKEPLVFIGKKELERLPVFGYIYKNMMITVDRKDPDSRRKVYSLAAEKLKQGRSICIFPEGGVPDESVFLDKFKNGAFIIALRHKVPIVNTTIYGLKEILPYAYFKGGPGTAYIYLNEISDTNDKGIEHMEDLKQHSYTLIYNKLKELYKE